MANPASLRRLQQMAMPTEADPAETGAVSWQQSLGESHDARVQQQRAAGDAVIPITSSLYAQDRMFNTVNRAREDAASGPGGWNRPWANLFEAMHQAAGDKELKVGGSFGTQNSPGPGLPPGYTEDRYRAELDAFAAGGKEPGFASSDFSGFPAIGDRFAREVGTRQQQAARQPASIAALARQGGR